MRDERQVALADAIGRLGSTDPTAAEVLSQLLETAFEQGRLAALDELQDRFCVCMK